jgi:hypothetical protein
MMIGKECHPCQGENGRGFQKGRNESLKNKVASPDVDKKEEEILVREERLDIGSYDSNYELQQRRGQIPTL